MEPFTPSLSAKICFLLNIERTEKDEELLGAIWNDRRNERLLELVTGGHTINLPVPLITSS